MLMSALRALVKNSIKESFDITFMENEKSCQNINCFYFIYLFFSFPIKTFFNWILNIAFPINKYENCTNLNT